METLNHHKKKKNSVNLRLSKKGIGKRDLSFFHHKADQSSNNTFSTKNTIHNIYVQKGKNFNKGDLSFLSLSNKAKAMPRYELNQPKKKSLKKKRKFNKFNGVVTIEGEVSLNRSDVS